MQTIDPRNVSDAPIEVPPTRCSTGGCCLFSGRRGLLLWLVLIGFVAYMQWPMLKGLYYKTTGATAPASAVAWRADFDAALSEARQNGKPVLIDFSASWCPPCQTMKHDVWTDAKVGRAVADGYVPVLVDVDDPKQAALSERYGVRSIPTILVVDADGKVLRQGSFMSSSELLEFLAPRA